MIRLDTVEFEKFCGHLEIPSSDRGVVPMGFWEPQRIWTNEVAAGLERDVHDFITLKGSRQIGGTTIADGLTLWWEQANDGTQGMLVSDEEDNRDYRRDVLIEMNTSLPKAWRLPMRLNNRGLAAWPNGSRLSFRHAGKRQGSNLGRSRGINFLHADEVGSWPDQQAISALRASLSQLNPQRLYLWNSTARGIGTPFHDMWKTAEGAVSQRAIFLSWWMDKRRRVERADKELWGRYDRAKDADERLWTAAVKKRYGHVVDREQLAWYRFQLAEQFYGDEVLLAQEFACLPEDAFQAFGEKFISPALVRRLRLHVAQAPPPKGLRYEFLDTLDETAEKGIHEDDPADAPLVVWEEPAPDGVYVVAGHPAYSSSEHAGQFIAQVYRVWPDKMRLVARYCAEQGAMYQFAWVLLHLCGAYRTFMPAYFILEVGATGYRVAAEITMMERLGFGLSKRARGGVWDFLGSIRHYFYHRPDLPFARPSTTEWKTGPNNRAWVLHGLRDTIERQQMELWSADLIDNLAAMRQGESGDADEIAGGAQASDADVLCAALAVECWLHSAMPDLEGLIAPKDLSAEDPKTAEQRLIQNYLGNMLATGRPPR